MNNLISNWDTNGILYNGEVRRRGKTWAPIVSGSGSSRGVEVPPNSPEPRDPHQPDERWMLKSAGNWSSKDLSMKSKLYGIGNDLIPYSIRDRENSKLILNFGEKTIVRTDSFRRLGHYGGSVEKEIIIANLSNICLKEAKRWANWATVTSLTVKKTFGNTNQFISFPNIENLKFLSLGDLEVGVELPYFLDSLTEMHVGKFCFEENADVFSTLLWPTSCQNLKKLVFHDKESFLAFFGRGLDLKGKFILIVRGQKLNVIVKDKTCEKGEWVFENLSSLAEIQERAEYLEKISKLKYSKNEC